MAREFPADLSDALNKGLRPDYRSGANKDFLVEITNGKPTPFGLSGHVQVEQAINITDNVFPFPQLFRGREVTLLCYETLIYTVDESDWSTTLLTLYDVDASKFDTVKLAEAGGAWHFQDFGTAWVLTNGVSTVMKLSPGILAETLVQDTVTVNTACVYHGRSIMAGFDSANFWKSAWTNLLYEYKREIEKTIQAGSEDFIDSSIALSHSIHNNYVMWSNIGGGAGDLFWLLFPQQVDDGMVANNVEAQGTINLLSLPVSGDFINVLGTIVTFGVEVTIGSTILVTARNLATWLTDNMVTITAALTSAELVYESVRLTNNIVGILGNLGTLNATQMESDGRVKIETFGITRHGTSYTSHAHGVHPVQDVPAGTTGVTPLWLEYIQENEMGFAPMPFQGMIQSIKPMLKPSGVGGGIVVYGANGIAVMRETMIEESLNTFGINLISKIGIPDRGAVGTADNEEVHVFLCKDGVLRSIDSDFKISRHGYKEYFFPLANPDLIIAKSDIAVNHNEEEEEFFISNNQSCYILTKSGLGSSSQLITSLINVDGLIVGMFDEKGEKFLEVMSDELDMGYRGMKTIDTVEVAGKWAQDPEFCLYYKYDQKKEWRQSRWVRANSRGSQVIMISANYIKVGVRVHPYSGSILTTLMVKWKREDLRDVRGIQPQAVRIIQREFE